MSGTGEGTLHFTSCDETIATVDGQTGEVTLLAQGTATITVHKDATATHTAASAGYVLNVLDGVKLTLIKEVIDTKPESIEALKEIGFTYSYSYDFNGVSYGPVTETVLDPATSIIQIVKGSTVSVNMEENGVGSTFFLEVWWREEDMTIKYGYYSIDLEMNQDREIVVRCHIC